ncbi:uncharacterized protein [Palaemon carinicauda]|uniref:uncharacterized protein n=1 Tax=Palaemon carinicauda TaxID=392227 RepID=UPI0035B6189F
MLDPAISPLNFRVTGEAYLYSTKIFFLESDYLPYNKLGKFMEIGFETSEGMQVAAENKRAAHTDFLKHMQHVLVEKFTKPDGTTSLYIGKTKIVHFPSCMPVPHDLPFLPHMDHIILKVVQSGLMDKWFNDEIEIARRKSIKQQREYREKLLEGKEEVAEDSSSGGGAGNLTLAHLQVAFMLYAAGNFVTLFVFLFEIRGKIACCS